MFIGILKTTMENYFATQRISMKNGKIAMSQIALEYQACQVTKVPLSDNSCITKMKIYSLNPLLLVCTS